MTEDEPKCVKKRNYSQKNISKFRNMLENMNWNEILVLNDRQSAFCKFYHLYKICFKESFPILTFHSNYRSRKHGYQKLLKQSIKTKNKLYALSVKRPSVYNINKHTKYKKYLKRIMRNAERKHYDDLFKDLNFFSNIRKSSEILKSIIHKKKVIRYNN